MKIASFFCLYLVRILNPAIGHLVSIYEPSLMVSTSIGQRCLSMAYAVGKNHKPKPAVSFPSAFPTRLIINSKLGLHFGLMQAKMDTATVYSTCNLPSSSKQRQNNRIPHPSWAEDNGFLIPPGQEISKTTFCHVTHCVWIRPGLSS